MLPNDDSMIRDAEMISNAQKPFELNVEKGDSVTIVSDTGMDPQIWSVLNNAAQSLGLDPTVVLMSKRDAPQAEPTPQVRKAMLASDICLMATSQAIVHSDAGIAAQQQNTKLIAMEEVTAEMLAGGAASVDYEPILEHGRELRELWSNGTRATLTTPFGTEIETGLDGRAGYFACGTIEEQPGVDLYVAAFPDGEAGISPVEGTTNGTVVWDTSMHEIGMLDEPIRATVEDGYVTDIEGGREAEQLKQMLENASDPEAYNIAEVSIGINPGATITGLMRQDKKSSGYIHVAVGANADTGGTIEAPIHVDGILSQATLTIDDTVVVKDGSVVV